MTVTNGPAPVIDLNAIRSILYLGLKGDVTLTTAQRQVAPRSPVHRDPAASGVVAAAGGIDTYA